MKKYLVKTKNACYECSDLQTMLKKISVFKVAGIEYQVIGVWYGRNKGFDIRVWFSSKIK